MIYVLYAIHIMVSLFLILVVLLQQGKGADLSVFGGGATQAAFGARGAATLLHKLTVVGFVAFIVTTMTIGLMQGHRGSSSVMSGVAVEESTATDDALAAGAVSEADEAAGAVLDETAKVLEETDVRAEVGVLDEAAGAPSEAPPTE